MPPRSERSGGWAKAACPPGPLQGNGPCFAGLCGLRPRTCNNYGCYENSSVRHSIASALIGVFQPPVLIPKQVVMRGKPWGLRVYKIPRKLRGAVDLGAPGQIFWKQKAPAGPRIQRLVVRQVI